MIHTRITPNFNVRVTPGGDTRVSQFSGGVGGGIMADPVSDQIIYWAFSEEAANAFPPGEMVAILETDYDFVIANHEPISWWKLDETTGTTLADQTSFKDLTLAETYTLDSASGTDLGAGVDFSDGHASTSVTTDEYTPSAMTVIAWVNLDATNIDFAPIIGRTNSAGSTSAQGWGIAFDDAGNFRFKVKDTTSTVGTDQYMATWVSPPINELIMIIGEWQAGGPARIYSNGDNLQGTSSNTNITHVVDNETVLMIGGAPGSATRRLDGVIYDVVVLPKVLTGAEKDELYAKGSV